jgi:long-chain fatty acid transport protein
MNKFLFNQSSLSSSLSQRAKLLVGSSLCAILVLPVSQATAGGFQLSDHSVTGLGRNHAGYGVVGDDASAAQFNPAGLTLLSEQQVQFGAVINMVSADIKDNGSALPPGITANSSEDGTPSAVVVPSFYYVHPVSEKLVLGLGFTAPFGTNTDYSDKFFGRFNGKKTELTALDLNPAFGYEINNMVSIGGGISVQKVDVTLGQATYFGADGEGDFEVVGDSIEIGYNLGITLNLADDSRIGLSYRSGIEHTVKGDATFEIPAAVVAASALAGNYDATADFESPATAYLGYYKPLKNHYFFTAGVRWTQWSVFEEIRIQFPNATLGNPLTASDAVTPIQWKDSYTYSVGLDARINQQWGWRTGLSFTETPVPDSTRSVRTVDSDRTAISFGGTYNMSSKLALDFAYRYISFADGPIDQTTTANGSTVGSTKANIEPNVHTVAIQANYKF